jgi:hypothetical protein
MCNFSFWGLAICDEFTRMVITWYANRVKQLQHDITRKQKPKLYIKYRLQKSNNKNNPITAWCEWQEGQRNLHSMLWWLLQILFWIFLQHSDNEPAHSAHIPATFLIMNLHIQYISLQHSNKESHIQYISLQHSNNEPHIQYIFLLYEPNLPYSLLHFLPSSFFPTLLSSLNSLHSWSHTSIVTTVKVNHPQGKIRKLVTEWNWKTYNGHMPLSRCFEVSTKWS